LLIELGGNKIENITDFEKGNISVENLVKIDIINSNKSLANGCFAR